VTIKKLNRNVKFWFQIFGAARKRNKKNPGSRRQGGGGGEPR
jgi:ribosomal protein L16/L10AE